MRLVCISAAHTPYNGELMERSAKRVGVEIVRFKDGEPWPNDYRIGKLVHGLACVLSLPADVTHIMHVDTSDSLFLAGPEEIVAKFEAMRPEGFEGILIQAEKNCYPDKALEMDYAHCHWGWHTGKTPWKYVNSGGWIAERVHAGAMMQLATQEATYCDQLCWSKAYLTGQPIILDENCQIFQSMYLQQPNELKLENGRLYNLLTGGRPCVAHWNGTKNQGHPYSRDGMWSCLNILSASCFPMGKEFTHERYA